MRKKWWKDWKKRDDARFHSILALIFLPILCADAFLLPILMLALHSLPLLSPKWQEYEISGKSMFPSMSGSLPQETCPRCDFLGTVNDEKRVVCMNCRWIFTRKDAENWSKPDVVGVDRWYYQSDEEWPHQLKFGAEVLVAPDMERHGVAVKRVWGMPGETVEIRGGKVFVNEARPVRNLKHLTDMAILVHDNWYRPRHSVDGERISRWKSTDGGWEVWPGGMCWNFHLDENDENSDGEILALSTAEKPAILEYHHAEGRMTPGDDDSPAKMAFQETFISNQRSENGVRMRSAEIHAVDELMLYFQLKYVAVSGYFMVCLPAASDTWETFYFAESPEAFREETPGERKHFYVIPPWGKRDPRFLISTLDGVPRVWTDIGANFHGNYTRFFRFLEMNKKREFSYSQLYSGSEPLEEIQISADFERNTPPPAEIFPESLRKEGGNLRNAPKIAYVGKIFLNLSNITIFRDEYFDGNLTHSPYFTENSLENPSTEGYYLLGDNSFYSVDSRMWGRIPEEKIIGVVRMKYSYRRLEDRHLQKTKKN